MGELGEEQADNVTPSGEGACLFVDAVLAGELGNKVGWNELAELGEYWQLRFGWFFRFHQADPKWDRPPATLKSATPMGWL